MSIEQSWVESVSSFLLNSPMFFVGFWMFAMVKSRYIGDGHPTFNRNPYNGAL